MLGVDRIERSERDERGRRIRIYKDNNADGIEDAVDYLEFNAGGALVKRYYNTDLTNATGNTFTINGEKVEGIKRVDTYTKLNARGQEMQVEYDFGADGTADRISYYIRNDQGHITDHYFNYDGKDSTGKTATINGEEVKGIDRFDKYGIDLNGRMIQVDYDFDFDGEFDRTHHIVRNASGFEQARYMNQDGKESTGQSFTVNGETRTGIDRIDTYTPNARGESIVNQLDLFANDFVDGINYYERNQNGVVVKGYFNVDGSTATGKEFTINGETVQGIDRMETYILDDYGRTKRLDYDYDLDGNADRRLYYVRNAAGDIEAIYTDTDASESTGNTFEINGETIKGIDSIVKNTLNERGHVIKIENDTNADGKVDNVAYIVRDARGVEITRYTDQDNNESTGYTFNNINGETIKGITLINYNKEIDSNGAAIETWNDTEADGSINSVIYVVRNDRNREIARYQDQDNNESTGYTYDNINGKTIKGITYVTKHEEWNAFGQVLKSTFDTNGDKTIDMIRYYERDTVGNISVQYENSDNLTTTGDTVTIRGEEVQGINSIIKYHRTSLGTQFAAENDTNADGNTDNLTFSHLAASLDMTTWDNTRLSDFGDKLQYIALSNATASTTLTLNKATIAAISQSGFQIRGDATDTVKLTDITAAEKLSATTSTGGKTYNQYQFTEGSDTYTLLIESAITDVQFGS